jgi:hypothetical protein
VGSNPTRGVDGCLLWVLCVVRKRSLRVADHSSRGVLPTVVRRCVWYRNHVNEETMAHWGVVAPKTNTETNSCVCGWSIFCSLFFKVVLMCHVPGHLVVVASYFCILDDCTQMKEAGYIRSSVTRYESSGRNIPNLIKFKFQLNAQYFIPIVMLLFMFRAPLRPSSGGPLYSYNIWFSPSLTFQLHGHQKRLT